MKLLINCIYIGLLASSFLFSQDDSNAISGSDARAISPIIQIRYDNFANEDFTPSSAIGIKLRIDEDRFTGFDDSVQNVNMYSFGVRYTLLNNVNTVVEYILSGDSNTDDFLRLSIGVEF